MIGSFFGPKEQQTYSLGHCKLFDTKYNSTPCTKLTLKTGSPCSYEMLRSITHPNLFPILKISQHSIYTKRIVPLAPFIDKTKKEYSRYIVSKVKNALEYIHTVLKKEHRAVCVEAIFLEKSGKVLLGNLEKAVDFGSTTTDDEMCNSLSITLTGLSLEELDTSSESIFDLIFDPEFNSPTAKPQQDRMSAFCRILQNKTEIPEITIQFIFRLFIEELRREGEKDHKVFILDGLYDLDRDYFSSIKKDMFSVIDSNVRMYLLKKFGQQSCGFDEICEDLSLGLRVKDKVLKKETMDFIFENSTQFNAQSMGFLIDTMQTCTDSETIGAICTHLLKLEREDVYRHVYRLILSFLVLDKSTLLTYKCIDRYFVYFDKFKITKDILPRLCAKLIEKENQEYCFSLVEKILDFLKEHKDEINGKEWSLKNIKSMFTKKAGPRDDLEERVSKICKEELSDWDEKDL